MIWFVDALLEREKEFTPCGARGRSAGFFCAATSLTPQYGCVSPPQLVAFISVQGKSFVVRVCVETQHLLCTHIHRTTIYQSIGG